MRAKDARLPIFVWTLAISVLAPAEPKPKIVIKAPRLQTMSPGLAAQGFGKRVDFNARLEDVPDDPKPYYCLDEVWDWGDGTESVYEPDCDPYEEGAELKRLFSDTHYYGPGRWLVSFALMHADEVVVHGTFEIRIF